MPWAHCGLENADDLERCAGCGLSKAQWTVEWNVTRTFQVRRRSAVRIRLVDGADRPVEGEPYRLTLPDGSTVDGALDDYGGARHDSSAPGTYRVTFTNRPAALLERLGAEGEPASGPEAIADAEGRFEVAAVRTLSLRLRGAEFVVELHHLLDDPSTKDDSITLRSSGDGGARYAQTRALADPAQAEPLEGDYLRVRFTGIVAGARYDLEVDPGLGPEGERRRPYLLFKGRTLPPPDAPEDEGPAPAREEGEAARELEGDEARDDVPEGDDEDHVPPERVTDPDEPESVTA